MEPKVGGEVSLDRVRPYLLLSARLHLGKPPRAKLEDSDVVQETLLEAHRKRGQFRGASEAELAAWLRQMLAFSIADARGAQGRAKRFVSHEQSQAAALNDSSSKLERFLTAPLSSPSQRVSRQEQISDWPTHWPCCPRINARLWCGNISKAKQWPLSLKS
jgi:RNA polymerase sigma-70 factor (ECF subfamily)